MPRKKRLHELAKELDVTTDRLMEIALRHGMRFTSNFNAVEPDQEEKLTVAVKGPLSLKKKRLKVRIRKKAAEIAAEEAAAALVAEEAEKEAEAEAFAEPIAELESELPVVAEEPVEIEETEVSQQVEQDTEVPVEAPAAETAELEAAVEHEVAADDSPAKAGEAEPQAVAPSSGAAEAEKQLPTAGARKERRKAGKGKRAPAGRVPLPEDVIRERVRAAALQPQQKPKPVAAAPRQAGTEVSADARSKRKRRRKRRKDREAPVSVPAHLRIEAVPGKKRAKMPSKPTVDHIVISEGITLKELADKLGIKAKDVIQKLLLEKGVVANINQVLDDETASAIAKGYGVSTETLSFEEEVALVDELQVEGEAMDRAPVVTLMGHVDHGKTTLLDKIRASNIVSAEHGGITQHIGAYKITRDGRQVVFLDTPGHEAFTRLRARGAQVTDIVILIVAADDGVMPQTVEAIQHARAAEVPVIVAITKVDKSQADVEKVKRGLSENDVQVEDWGGDVVCVEVSGVTGQGIQDLLEMILLVAEMRDLKAYPAVKGVGTVIEARLDRARGPVATILVQNGTVRIGDFFIAGGTTGRVKALIDDNGERLEDARPSTPVEVLGFNEVPESGDQFQVVEDEAKARQMVSYRVEQSRAAEMATKGKLSLDDLFSRIEEGQVKELPLVVKTDVRGSLEALTDSLETLSTEKVKVVIKLGGVGAITDHDVLLASTADAIIIGFNVRPQRTAAALADKEGVEIRTYNVIYEVTQDVRDAMVGLLEPTFREVVIGKAEVRQVFKVPKIGKVAGCYVSEGEMRRNAGARVIRDDVVIHEGRVSSLKRFKEDVREVKSGFECGIGVEGFKDVREQDVIEMFVKEEVSAEM